MSNDKRPILGISVGDPGGIGPEITAKALAGEDIYDLCRPLVVADSRFMADVLRFTGLKLSLHPVRRIGDARFLPGILDVLDMRNMPPDKLRYKTITSEQGRASFEYVAKVIELAMNKEIDGTVTGPINKAAIHAGGHRYAGQFMRR
jgi:4-hydroxy-L-threonine phosphate dehydrogenase PdxA